MGWMLTLWRQWAFTVWLCVAVGLAIVCPMPAATGGVLHSEWTTKLGISVIFFLLGLSLPLRQLMSGFRPLRLHVYVLLWNFLLFAVVVSGVLLASSDWLLPEFKLGFWVLAMMPTTIASAVTFTSLSGGHTANAIFSTVLSNVLAVFLFPVLAAIYLSVEVSVSVPLLPLLGKLSLLVVLPLVLGQGVRRVFRHVAESLSPYQKRISSWIILFIVHVAFANGVQSGVLDRLSLVQLIQVLGVVCAVLMLTSVLVWWTCGWLRFNPERRVAAFFSASQKSLATGVPLTTAVLASVSLEMDSALLLMPLILFHPLQLILAGVLSPIFAKWHQPRPE